jgi:hypothetical protein
MVLSGGNATRVSDSSPVVPTSAATFDEVTSPSASVSLERRATSPANTISARGNPKVVCNEY